MRLWGLNTGLEPEYGTKKDPTEVQAYACSLTATELNLSCRQRKFFEPLLIGF